MTILLVALALVAQTPDARGGVSGRVLIRGENAPVQDARVALVRIRRGPLPPSPNGAPPAPTPQTLTAPDGSYTLTALEPGDYSINVQKTGFAVGIGASPRATITVVAGQTVQAPDMFLERGSAIAGRILDANGEPVVDAHVVALGPRPLPPGVMTPPVNGPRLVPAGQPGRTNDLGEYRIFGLLPGEYVVAASLEHNPFMTASTSPTTLATTYFPGVTGEGSAQRVTVSPGQTTSGIDIRMTAAAAFLVSGIVVTGDGQPVEGAAVWLNAQTPGISPFLAHTDRSGRFQVGGVPAGTYRISVGMSSNSPLNLHLPGQMNLTVSDGNLTGVRLVVVPDR